MMTEIAATAVNAFEVIKSVDSRLGQLESQQTLFIEGIKDRLNVIEFGLEELENLIWHLASMMSGQDNLERINREFDRRTSLREQLNQYRRNLSLLEEQKAAQGAYPDLNLLNQIGRIQAEIEKVESELHDHDHSNS